MRRITVDVPRLFALWNDQEMTRTEVARALEVSDKALSALASRHGLGNRGWRPRFETNEATPEEDAASGDSLALSPWVQARIKELRLGMPAQA